MLRPTSAAYALALGLVAGPVMMLLPALAQPAYAWGEASTDPSSSDSYSRDSRSGGGSSSYTGDTSYRDSSTSGSYSRDSEPVASPPADTSPAAPTTSSTSPAAPTTSSTSPAAPTTSSTSPAAPTTSSTSPVAPTTRSTSPAAPTTGRTRPAAPITTDTSPAAPPTERRISAAERPAVTIAEPAPVGAATSPSDGLSIRPDSARFLGDLPVSPLGLDEPTAVGDAARLVEPPQRAEGVEATVFQPDGEGVLGSSAPAELLPWLLGAISIGCAVAAIERSRGSRTY